MIKTTAIIFASAASLGASTSPAPTSNPEPKAPTHFEITAGPLNIIRENGETNFKIDPASNSLLRVELSSGKTLNIQL